MLDAPVEKLKEAKGVPHARALPPLRRGEADGRVLPLGRMEQRICSVTPALMAPHKPAHPLLGGITLRP